ncbi:MAG: fibronectin type III-like domain-contianing protein, partial [Candidatus Dormibacteraeota bacterium]|nr:fibronectin type III-like domain-contianing protein [Candidatus Dormibacteraeota bacterium]
PGQLGGQALAEVLTGTVNPSGRLPVSVPRDSGALPATYLAPQLALRSKVSSVDPTPAFPFGHGLSYTTFAWDGGSVVSTDAGATGSAPVAWPVDGAVAVAIDVENTGTRAGVEVVQLYLHDPVAQTTRPVARLIGYARVPLDPGERARVRFTVHADLTSFTARNGRRVVEPGDVELRLGRSSRDIADTLRLRLVGAEREVGHDRQLLAGTWVQPLAAPAVAEDRR